MTSNNPSLNPLLLVAVALTSAFAVASCGSSSTSTGPHTANSDSATATTGNFKLVVEGRELEFADGSSANCQDAVPADGHGFRIGINSPGTAEGAYAEFAPDMQLLSWIVTLQDDALNYGPYGSGDATFTRNGNSFKFNGHLASIKSPEAKLESVEMEVTCL